MSAATSVATRPRVGLLLGLGLVLAALNLRTTVTSLPPFALEIRHDLGLSAAAVGLLTSLPVLCMAWLGVVAHRLSGRFGRSATTLAAIVCVTAGNGLRAAGDETALLFAATLLAGVGIAACGVMLPGLVKATFPAHTGIATAASSAAMLLGAVVAGALSVPLSRRLGSWEAALGFWALPALPAVLVWARIARRRQPRESVPREEALAHASPSRAASALPWRARAAWLLCGFFALQSALGYAYLAWLPAAYEDRGWSQATAGGLNGVLHLGQLVTALLLPWLIDRGADGRRRDRRPALVGAVSLTACAALWLWALPDVTPWAAAMLAGLGLGGGFSLTLLLIVDYAGDAAASTGLAAMTFLVGYSIAALAPLAVGALRDSSGGYGVPFAMLTCVAFAQLGMATRLGPRYRDTVGQPASATAKSAAV
ncbi:MAG TPA: MFS transporter [Conexibacter sp.]|nr:MFS transporter [Conexibacter sp.]